MIFLATSIKSLQLGVGYFNVSDPEIGYYSSKFRLEVAFRTALESRKRQMPSSA